MCSSDLESEFGSSLRERKSATLDEAQIDALEVEANFTSMGKSKGMSDHDARRRGKEEASTSSQDREVADYKIEEMRKMIKKLSSKLVKLELEAKNSSSKPFQTAPNRGFNPQYRKPPLQILQRDRKEQQDHIQPPLYLEGQMDGPAEDIPDGKDDQYLAYSDSDEVESSL